MIAKGYKQTEIGIIPEDWSVVELGEIADTKGGYAFKSKSFSLAGKYQVVKMTNLYGGLLDLKRSKSFLNKINLLESEYLLKKGNILITLTGTVGKTDYGYTYTLFNEKNLLLNQRVGLIKTNTCNNSFYLGYLCKTTIFLSQFYELSNGGTGNQTNVSTESLKSIQIPLPPTLKEQEAIAKVLTDTDNLIQALEKVIAKKKAIKKGAMQQLLTPPNKGGKRLPGFSGEWVEKSLGEVLKSHQLGGNYINKELSTDSPLIKMGNLNRGKISLKKIEYIPNEVKTFSIDILKFGDVLFNTRNTLDLVGKVAIWRGELPRAYFNSNIMRLEFKNEFIGSNFFMNNLLNTKKIINELKGFATGTTSVAAIYTRDLKKLQITIPSPKEQEAIATVLSDMDKEIEALEVKKEKYIQLKKGLAQELLTGKTRLV
jgi:type I restriction enzyme S subunit